MRCNYKIPSRFFMWCKTKIVQRRRCTHTYKAAWQVLTTSAAAAAARVKPSRQSRVNTHGRGTATSCPRRCHRRCRLATNASAHSSVLCLMWLAAVILALHVVWPRAVVMTKLSTSLPALCCAHWPSSCSCTGSKVGTGIDGSGVGATISNGRRQSC